MVRFIIVLCVFFLAFTLLYAQDTMMTTATLNTDEMQFENTPLNKLGRGVINTASCWTEIIGQSAKVSKEKNLFLGLTIGVTEGVITGLVRGLTGILDITTFLFPPYNQPLVEPEYNLKSANDKLDNFIFGTDENN